MKDFCPNPMRALICLLLGGLLVITACSDEITGPLTDTMDGVLGSDESGYSGSGGDLALFDEAAEKGVDVIHQIGDQPPDGLVSVAWDAASLTLCPYTGRAYDGDPSDPVNVIFAGETSPLQIRAALLALDGDRTAYGFPDVFPFNAAWSDIVGGDVQTTYSDGTEGWAASAIQLMVGDFGPVRVHLRLFQTAAPFGDGVWTIGATHFEVLIPGTADHQVLSWELAEQLVVVDMMRTGLLHPTDPMRPSGMINTVDFRTIPPEIYNALPAELIALIGGPPQPVTDPVPIPSDGIATMFQVATAVEVVAGSSMQNLTITYDQFVPRPFCSDGPGDWLYVTGPVAFSAEVSVSANGSYRYRSQYDGVLTAVPIDIETGEPIGPPFDAQVNGWQRSSNSDDAYSVQTFDRRLTLELGAPQLFFSKLRCGSRGQKTFDMFIRCVDEDDVAWY